LGTRITAGFLAIASFKLLRPQKKEAGLSGPPRLTNGVLALLLFATTFALAFAGSTRAFAAVRTAASLGGTRKRSGGANRHHNKRSNQFHIIFSFGFLR
jgi:hypothetical protein